MLDRKLLRDLARMRGQVISIALVIMSGVAIFIASLGSYYSLLRARADYYQTAHFADVFAGLKRAPEALRTRMEAIPGIAALETRIVRDVTIDLPAASLPVSGRLVSLPARDGEGLNRLHLRHGRLAEAGSLDEVVVSEAFADANRLAPGGSITAILNGRLQALRIVGVALSAEYVFATRSGEAIPDDARFGVFWMHRRGMEAAFDMAGAFNDVVASLVPGAAEASVLVALDRLLEPYGGLIAFGRDLQPSSRFLADEIAQQGVMAQTIPVVFLAVSAFLLHVVLDRTVRTQREQIASLKALGFADMAIAAHYLKLTLAIVIAGALPGLGVGIGFGQWMTDNYTIFFRFPRLDFVLPGWVPLLATGIALLAGASGALGAIRSVLRLTPAEAMRPPAPLTYRHNPLDRIGWVRRLPARSQMMLRNITGRPLRAAFTTLGVALAVPIIVVSQFWDDALTYMIDVQFPRSERAHATVVFTRPVAMRAAREIAGLPNVLAIEAMRAVPVQLRVGHHTYRTAISGLPEPPVLRRPLDTELRPIPLPPEGLLLSRRLAERLGARPGDLVGVEVLEGKRPQASVWLAGVVDDLIGMAAYMDIHALNRLMREGDAISAVAVLTDRHGADALYAALKKRPLVETVSVKQEAMRRFRQTTARFVLVMAGLFTLFSCLIAIGVVYNNARVALQERSWELASLRVLGFTRAEVTRVLLAEIVLEAVVAIPLGLWLGTWLVRALIAMHTTEMFQIPAVIEPRSYVIAAGIVLGAVTASALIVRRRIDRLDLVGVLKTRE